jgi:uncharacterized damage-inducible protein DinB
MRHDVWATGRLVDHLRALPESRLDLTVPGTYGTVRRTLTHIVAADESYLVRLLGTVLHDPQFRADHDASLDEIAEHLRHVKDAVERVFSGGPFDAERVITDTPLRRSGDPRIEMAAWVPATQFVHHGSDHRAHIGTTLGANGLEPPDVQIWPFAVELGATRQVR